MKNVYFVLILLLVTQLIACTTFANSIDSLKYGEKFPFVDDSLLLNDMERETRFVDSAICMAKTLNVKSDGKSSNALPLNSREQVIKFFKYLNTAVESDGELWFVFWDKSSNRIVDLSMQEKDHSMYIGLTREEFENKLKAGDIDFKLLKNKLEIQDTVPVVPLMNSLGDEGDLEPTDTMYEKHFREATGSDYVLGGVTRLCTQLLWYKKMAYPGFVLSAPRPGIEEWDTFFTEVYFGDFQKSADGFSYRESTKKIEGHIMGRYEVTSEWMGLKIGSKYKIEARMKVDMDNHVEYKASSSLFK